MCGVSGILVSLLFLLPLPRAQRPLPVLGLETEVLPKEQKERNKYHITCADGYIS